MKIVIDISRKKKEKPQKAQARKSGTITRQPVERGVMKMDSLLQAVTNALDRENSDRIDLLSIYRNAWKDPQVIAEREKADAFIIAEPFEVIENGSVSEEKVELFRRPWFIDFLTLSMHVEFWGYTIIEFGLQDESGEFIDVKVFPREHVKPFKKIIVVNPQDSEGLSYEGNETGFFLIALGDPEELGKLETIAKEVIWKSFSRSDWSEFNERYGKPFLEYETDVDNDSELDKKAEAVQNAGSNMWFIHNSEEKLTPHQVSTLSAGANFEKSARFCDEQISKLMNGQTGTTDEKSYVGSAEVHERVLSSFNKARLLRVQNIINYRLIPFLTEHGYPVADCHIEYPILRDQENIQKAPQAPQEPANTGKKTKKKKTEKLPSWVLTMQE